MKNNLLKAIKTCICCPVQWEGFIKTNKGIRPFYLRYRWEYLSIRVGKLLSKISKVKKEYKKDIESAVNGEEIFSWYGEACLEDDKVTREILEFIANEIDLEKVLEKDYTETGKLEAELKKILQENKEFREEFVREWREIKERNRGV